MILPLPGNDNGSGIDGAWDAVAGEETGNEPDAVTENGSDMVTAGPRDIITDEDAPVRDD